LNRWPTSSWIMPSFVTKGLRGYLLANQLAGISNIWCYNIGVGHIIWAKKLVGNVAYLFWSNFHFSRMGISSRRLFNFNFSAASTKAFKILESIVQAFKQLENSWQILLPKVAWALKKRKMKLYAWRKSYRIYMFWKNSNLHFIFSRKEMAVKYAHFSKFSKLIFICGCFIEMTQHKPWT